jgi:Kef-type K+ transport system membrane component KefB
MTYYVLIALCVIILIAYFFDITSRRTKIPGVLLLILTGMAIRSFTGYYNLNIPEMNGILPFMGTLGLILIVLDASLDLTLCREKSRLIINSLSSSIMLFLVFVGFFTFVSVYFLHYDIKTSIINIIPFGIISSAVAIPSAVGLSETDREFVTYESAISDIFGILAFNYIIFSNGSLNSGVFGFFVEIIITLIVSVLFSAGLTVMLHKINHHVKYVVIMTVIVLVYALAKLIHLPSLLVVLIFGLIMNNNVIFKNSYSMKIINFDEFNVELNSFKNIAAELTFIVRSFFFVLFGFYTRLSDLLSLNNLIIALIITTAIFILRALYFKVILRLPLNPLLYFAPRGLITILLFLSIPGAMLLPFMNVGVITQVIFITILLMTFGNIIFKKVDELATSDSDINIMDSSD